MIKLNSIKFLLGICCVVGLVIILIFLLQGSSLKDNAIVVKVDGIDKTLNFKSKTFEEICKESSGLWMPKSMGMTELRKGVSVGIEKCSGCMPDKDNMFCELNSYTAYIKQNGVNTTGFKMGGGVMEMNK